MVALSLPAPEIGWGERPTILSLTTAQGLVSNSGIFSIEQDRQGYLWIGTHEGVSRFDGSEFRNYGVEEGLNSPPQIQQVFLSREGEVWTSMFPRRYNPYGNRAHLFQDIPGSPFAKFLREDASGSTWAVGDGLYRIANSRQSAFERVCLESRNTCNDDGFGDAFEMAKDRSLWISDKKRGVIRRLPSGQVQRFGSAEGFPFAVLSLMCDRDGQMWAGTSNGVFRFEKRPSANDIHVEEIWGKRNGFPGCAVNALRQTRDGHIWVGTRCGLIEIDGARAKRFSIADGLSQNVIESIFEARDGELWLGTESAGIMRVERNGVSAFGSEAGLDRDVIDGVLRSVDGRVVVVSNRDSRLLIRAGNEAGFSPLLPSMSLQPTDLDVEHWQIAMEDREGFWWVPGENTMRIFAPAVKGAKAMPRLARVLDNGNGFPAGRIDCMLEDRNGDIWFGLFRPPHSTLFQWIRSTGAFRSWEGARGVPNDRVPVALTETRSGSIWIAYREGELGRYRNGKHFLLPPAVVKHGQTIFAIHEDGFGRLWTGRRPGDFYEVMNPDSDRPWLRAISGVAAPFLRCILSDHDGRLYLGSEAGLIQYDPATGSIRHFHERDGLPSDVIQSGTQTGDGALWFGTGRGLMRFEPRKFSTEPSPAVWIDAVDVAGTPLAGLSDRGERTVNGVRLNASGSSLRIGFHAINFHSDVRFEYRLTPGDGNWSRSLTERSVTFPRLSAGRYQFAVRALRAGTGPGEPATVAFEVLPPLWQRSWFIAIALFSAAALLTIAYRYRVIHLLQLERLRMRIASDLHDDLGAGLTQIAVLSDQLRFDNRRNGAADEGLARIADTAREMTSALGDVVWSLGPERDRLVDLFVRVRRIGNDLCDAHGVEFSFTHPASEDLSPLDGHMRRHILLIFKEALRNAVRHARCRRFQVVCRKDGDSLCFVFEDDGDGFNPRDVTPGQGLTGMAARAKSMSGSLTILSPVGHGTSIELSVPARAKRLGAPLRFKGKRAA